MGVQGHQARPQAQQRGAVAPRGGRGLDGRRARKLLETLTEGAIVNGVVKNITDYGAFVDLGGIDGLLHITDMAWRRVRHPSEVVQVGQELQAKVLKFDAEKNRVSLAGHEAAGRRSVARRLAPLPAGHAPVRQGHEHRRLRRLRRDRAGHRRKVHVSEMDWTNKNVAPSKVVSLGDEVEVMVLEIDEDKRRISLGMKQCKANPWEEFAANVQRGDKVKGPSSRSPTSACSSAWPPASTAWCTCPTCRGTSGRERGAQLQEGPEVEAVVLAVDVDRERISLGIKQLDSDPFTSFTSVNDRGMTVNGRSRRSTRAAPRSSSTTT